jgi:hypothetical protein
MLPLESAAIFLRGNKLTEDISEPTRFALATPEAQRFYIEDHNLSAEKFDAVDFPSLNYALAKKKRGYTDGGRPKTFGFLRYSPSNCTMEPN